MTTKFHLFAQTQNNDISNIVHISNKLLPLQYTAVCSPQDSLATGFQPPEMQRCCSTAEW